MTVPAVVTLTNGTSAWANQVATDVNGLLASVASLSTISGVPRYLTTAARDTAIPSPQQGNLVYVVASDDYWYYTGAAWANFMDHPDLISRYAPLGIGETAYAEQVTAQGPFGPAIVDVAGVTVTFTAIAGAKYMLTANVEIGQNSAGNVTCTATIADGANAVIVANRQTIIAGSYGSFNPMRRVTPGAGSITYKLRVSAGSGTIGTGANASLMVQRVA